MRYNTVYTLQWNTVQQNTGQYEILQCIEIQRNESVQYIVSRQRCPRVLSCLLPSSPSGRTHATCPQLSASSSPSPLSSLSPSSSSYHRHRHHHHKDHLLLSSVLCQPPAHNRIIISITMMMMMTKVDDITIIIKTMIMQSS